MHRQIPPASHKTSVPSGTFLYIDMRYTKQAMTLVQQIQTLQSIGFILLFKAIQTIEVAVRSKVIKHFAPTCGPFWFMDATKAVNQRRFKTNLETVKKEVGRSQERYIREHIHKYTDPDLPPVWETLE